MARPVRIRVAGGWYHVMARGHNRETLFADGAEHEHFLELMREMRDRYRVRVYAYCLMRNHYHLLLGTPEGNLSEAMQWLNGSYGVWQGKRQERVGHLFAGRFKAILVEDGSWGLEVSVYMHMNPVATEEMGLGKRGRAAQRRGMGTVPKPEELAERLEALRRYPWSSYRAYAGYEGSPAWLDMGPLRSRMGKKVEVATAAYRGLVEGRLRQEEVEPVWSKVKWGLVLGGEGFAKRVRGKVRLVRESEGVQEFRQRRRWDEIVKWVEGMSGKRWEVLRDRHGDWWRDLALWAGRRYCGMRLAELGEKAGGVDYTAVSMALKRLEARAAGDSPLHSAMRTLQAKCDK